MVELDNIDKRILNMIQMEFPLVSRPFKVIGNQLNLEESEVISRIKRLQEIGAIRRIGPIINTQKIDGCGTLVAMKVPSEDVERVAKIINEYKEVSHNYLRNHKYNIWFTLYASSKERLNQILKELKKKTGYRLMNLPTVRFFKIGFKFDIK